MSGDHPNYSIVKIGQNTKKSPGDLRRLVTQTPMENRQRTLVCKTLKRVNTRPTPENLDMAKKRKL